MTRLVDCLVVHCSDTPDEMDIGRVWIDREHRAPPRNWQAIGYHYVVRRNGVIEVGRGEHEVGAHALGYNEHSIGICWVGRGAPSVQQRAALVGQLRDLMARYKIGPHRVFGHVELNPGRTCPNIDMTQLRTELSGPE